MKFIMGFSSFSVKVRTTANLKMEKWIQKFLIKHELKENVSLNIFLGNFNSKIFKVGKYQYTCFISKKNFGWQRLLILIKNILYDYYSEFGVFFLHASAVYFNRKTLVFCGESNSGKTTIARKLNTGNNVINDDNIIIHKKHEKYYVSSFPLNRNKDLINNLFKRIDKFFLIEKSDKNEIFPVKSASALVLENLYPPERHEEFNHLIEDFCKHQKIYMLKHFTNNYEEFKKVIG